MRSYLTDTLRRPGQGLSVLVCTALVAFWGLIRLWIFPDFVMPLGFGVPLLACVWTRRPALVWAMAAAFVATATIEIFWLLPPGHLRPTAIWASYIAQPFSIVVAAGLVHGILLLRERMEGVNAALSDSNERLAASGEEVARQNEELTAQSEELAQQNEELRAQGEELEEQAEELTRQGEELQTVNEELSRREDVLEHLLATSTCYGAEDNVLQELCRHGLPLMGPEVVAAAVVQPCGDELRVQASFGTGDWKPAQTDWPLERSLARVIMEQNRTACLEDSSLRPELVFPAEWEGSGVSVLATPLRAGERVLGALEFYAPRGRLWTQDQFRLAEWLATQCSPVLEMLDLRRQVRDSEKRFRTIFERAAIGIVRMGLDGRFIEFNDSACLITGYTREALTSLRFHDITHPADLEATTDRLRELIAGRIEAYTLEKRYIRPDGSPVWVSTTKSLVRDEHGEPSYCIAIIEDVSQRKLAQEALRTSEQRLRLALESGRMGTWDWELSTGGMDWSEGHYRLLGYTPGEVRSDHDALRKRVHPEDLPRMDEEIRKSMEQNREYSCAYRVIWPDGSTHWVEGRGRYAYGGNGTATRMYGVVMDIDERQRMEQERAFLLDAERTARTEVERVNRIKDEFLATVSHELRSPLSAIVGWARLLARGKAEPERAADVIQKSAISLTQIVEDMLDMGRIISGKIRLNRERVELVSLVSSVVDGVQFSAEAKDIRVEVSFDPTLEPIECDPNRVQQIIWNLLTNAIKFTPAGGRVCVAVMQEERSIRIRVEDTGEGITPEFLPHIFDRFRQQDGSITRKHGGLGLGLAIVKNLVELHAGTASAESDGQGKGAAFTVVLPSCVNDGPGLRALLRSSGTAPTTAVAHSVVPSLEGVRVLVVDDAPHSRELLSQVLAESGASVQTVDSARHALRLLHEFNPNVLISDVGMPEMDGYSFIRRVREAGNSCGALPCLAVTALARPEDRARALASGFNDHLAKPVDPAMLTRVVAFLSGRASAPAR